MSTLYEVTIPVFARGLKNLRHWLTLAEQHAGQAGIPMSELLEARLAPDMFNLTQQVQYAYFTCLEAAENLCAAAQPAMSYEEKTAGELYASIDQATGHLASIDPAEPIQPGTVEVTTFLIPDRKLPVAQYVNQLALPNFYFHTVTAYCILRHKGVRLGKDDYLGVSSV